ncbi:hypothetical protein FRB99_000777 [Tulasnella sp. 403]|nr:hypothetical protein FRB99_000777 [Tulasnella sp. 403]
MQRHVAATAASHGKGRVLDLFKAAASSNNTRSSRALAVYPGSGVLYQKTITPFVIPPCARITTSTASSSTRVPTYTFPSLSKHILILRSLEPSTLGNNLHPKTKTWKKLRARAFAAYETLRRLQEDRSFLFEIPVKGWKLLFVWAHQLNDEAMKETLINDLMDCLARRQETYQEAILDVFDLTAYPHNAFDLSDQQVMNLFHALSPTFNCPSLYTTPLVTRVAEAMLNDDHFSIHLPFLRAAYPFLISPPPRGVDPTIPPEGLRARSLWALFRFIERLLRPSNASEDPRNIPPHLESLTIEILSAISSAGCIPRSILDVAFDSITKTVKRQSAFAVDHETLRMSTFQVKVMSCFSWGWHRRALKLLRPVLDAESLFKGFEGKSGRRSARNDPETPKANTPCEAISPAMCSLVHSITSNLLVHPSDMDFNAASALIVAYANSLSTHPDALLFLPDDLLHKYYDAATISQSTAATSRVYRRLLALNAGHSTYLPPRPLLSRLLRSYFRLQRPTRDAQELIVDVLDHDYQIQFNSNIPSTSVQNIEPETVTLVAQLGHLGWAMEMWLRARAGWKGYSRLGICGSAAVVSSIVKACVQLPPTHHRLSAWMPKAGRRLGFTSSDVHPGIHPMRRKDFALLVLRTFEELQIKGTGHPSPMDLRVHRRCCELLKSP